VIEFYHKTAQSFLVDKRAEEKVKKNEIIVKDAENFNKYLINFLNSNFYSYYYYYNYRILELFVGSINILTDEYCKKCRVRFILFDFFFLKFKFNHCHQL
jgi:hypothetical protein